MGVLCRIGIAVLLDVCLSLRTCILCDKNISHVNELITIYYSAQKEGCVLRVSVAVLIMVCTRRSSFRSK